MFCPKCGSPNDDRAARCARCGDAIQAIGAAPPTKLSDNTAMRMLLPVGRSWIAIAAGYAGLFAIVCFPAPIALGLGLWALRDLKQHPDKFGKGRAIFGTVMGAIGTLGLVVFFMIRVMSRK